MRLERYGALAVLESANPPKEIQAALRQIDPRLFLERQVTMAQEEVWCVVVDAGSSEPPITILEWRDENGDPIHDLYYGLVRRMERMQRDGLTLSKSVMRKNEELIEAHRKKSHDALMDLRSMIPSILGTRSVNFKRGVSLRMHRDKMRARGENV